MTGTDIVAVRYALQRGTFTLDVDVELPLRGITGVFGRSGAGKTTLLRCIAGLERVAGGRLVVAGEAWQDGSTSLDVHERRIGYVFQEPRLFEHLDVRRNIEYGRRRRPADAVDFDGIVAMLDLRPLLGRRPAALSGGEAQRVAIARALACAPRFVLMDEPVASLDRDRKEEILPFLDRLHTESRVPIVYVSHSVEEIGRLCDYLLVMERGRVVAQGALQDVLACTDLPILGGDEAGAVIDGEVEAYDSADELLRVRTAAGTMWVPGPELAVGTSLRLRIRANDVSLCRSRPEQSTILNIVPAVVRSIGQCKGPSVLVRLDAGADTLLARVTRRSARELRLDAGEELLAQIKSVAVRAPLAGRE